MQVITLAWVARGLPTATSSKHAAHHNRHIPEEVAHVSLQSRSGPGIELPGGGHAAVHDDHLGSGGILRDRPPGRLPPHGVRWFSGQSGDLPRGCTGYPLADAACHDAGTST
jgi:hypothetical protein